ncbi:uncharacterized protein LOC111870471 isoform X2 [Cryptotermes secundus]|uniref:uncharacterized protein LOC111870471 isoform X2 n=1 Tax=Cryptotermes secundus TaxID=105785 RepID=UPI001454C8D5|nr:uncharacterized protein LOC111870471 isoform X2 [Cryptotermes secundus]
MSKNRTHTRSMVLSTQLSQESEGSKTCRQTSSILKLPKDTKHREPLQELDFRSNIDEDGTSTTSSMTKRVSFHKAVQTKEFHVEEAVTVWGSTYEETFKGSDSSHHSDNSSCPSSSKVPGFNHPLCSNINSQFLVESHAVKGREGMKQHGNVLCFHAVNSDTVDSDDEQCFSPNEMHVWNQSNDMDFTEPLDVNFPNFNHTDLLANNEIDLTEPLACHIDFDQKWHSQLSPDFPRELKTTGEIDMTLTETLPDVCFGFKDHVKSQEMSKKSSKTFVKKVNIDTAEPEILMKVSSKGQVKDSEANSDYLIDRKTHTGILTQINNSNISFTEVVSCNKNKYEPNNTDKVFQLPPHCDTNVDRHESSVINQSMDLTETLVEMKSLNSMEMFKRSVQCDRGYDRLQPTGRTCIHANDFGTPNPQGFTKIMDSIEKKMVNISSLSAESSGNTESMCSNSECLHEGSKVNVQNTGSTKPVRNIVCSAFTSKTYMHDITENVQNFGLINSDGETYMNKIVDSPTRCTEVSDVEFIDELKQKEFDSAKTSSQITDVGDMELTCNINHKNIHIPFRNSAHNSYMQIRKNHISDPIQVSNTAAVVDEMEFTSIIKLEETCNSGNVNRSVSDMELRNEIRQNQISNPLAASSHNHKVADMELTSAKKWEDTCNSGDIHRFVNGMELTNKTRQKQTSNPIAVSSHIGNITDMELTSGINLKETVHPGDVNRFVSDMALTNQTRQKQTSNPIAVSSHIGNITDMELTSGINLKEICNPGEVNRFVNDMELTNKTRQKQTSNPIAVSSHIGNITDMELPSGINLKETVHPGDVNRFASDMTLTNKTRQKQTSNPIAVSSHIGNITDMELPSGINLKETVHPGDVNRFASDMTLTNKTRQKQTSNPIAVSSHIGNITDMELPSGINLKETVHPGDVNRFASDMTLTNKTRQKQTSNPIAVSSHIGNITDMELPSGINLKETVHPGDVNRFASDMTLTNKTRQKQTSNPIAVSSHIGNITDMELPSGINLKETVHPGDVNRFASDMTLTNKTRQKQTSNPIAVSSHIGNITDMELPSGINLKETVHPGDVNRFASDMTLTNKTRQKQTSNPIAVSSHIGNITDMELPSGINLKETVHPGDVNRFASDMTLTNKTRQKQTSNPIAVSSHIGNITDMELPSGINLKETVHPGDVNRFASDMTLTNKTRQKQTSNPIAVSSHIGNITDMELPSGINLKETVHPGDVNRFASDMTLTNKTRQKQTSNPIAVSSHIGNITDMELPSGINLKETVHPGDVNRFASDMTLTNKTRQKQTSNPIAVSSHIGNITDMELTSGINLKAACHSGDMTLTNKTRLKQTSNPVAVFSHISDVTSMELISGINWKETCTPEDVNRHVNDMELTNDTGQNQVSHPVAVASHIGVTDVELTNEIKWKEICNTADVNRHIIDMELINESRQERTSRPAVVFSQGGNVTDMELTSGIVLKEICNTDVNRYLNDMKLTSVRREEQMSAKSTNVSNLELRNEVRQKIFNRSRVTDLSKDAIGMELSEVNQKAICNQSLMISECDSHAKAENIDDTQTWKEKPRVPFNHTSNKDCINSSEEEQMGDTADVSHLLKSCNMNPVYNVKALYSNDLEKVTQHCEPAACISVSGDRASQSDYVEAETSLKQASSSKQTIVQVLGRTEKCKAKDNSVTLFKQTDSTYYFPPSKVTHPNTDGRCSEQTGSVLDVKRENASENCSSMELNVETSVPAVSLNLNIPLNVKELGKRSQKCDMNVSHLGQKLVNEIIQKTADESSLLHDRHVSEDSNTSSDKVSQVSHTSRMDNGVIKENLSMQLLREAKTYTGCTTGTAKKLSVEYDIGGNAASHNNQQYATKGIPDKICTQENSTENMQMLKSNARDSFILGEELDDKQGWTTNQLTLNEYLEPSDLHVRMRTPLEIQGNQIMEQVNSATPMKSKEYGVMKGNLDCSQLQSTLASMPDEMELSIIKDLSHESNESYNKLVENVRIADEIIREKTFMTDECDLLDNSQCAQQNSEEGTSLLQKLSNMGNIINELVTRKEESTKHLELKTVTGQEKCNLDEKFKPSIKQTDEQMKPRKLRINQSEDVTISSLEEQIKAEELRSGHVWSIKDISNALWSFQFLYKSLTLILKLNPCEMKDSGKVVTDIQLISHATEKADPLVIFVHHVLLRKFQTQALESMCRTTLDVVKVLETISAEVKKLKIFVKDIIELETLDMLRIENTCVSFEVADLNIHAWFRINVNIDMWEDISPADVSAENLFGSVREHEIKHLVTAATRGPNCLRDYIRIIKEYVKVYKNTGTTS